MVMAPFGSDTDVPDVQQIEVAYCLNEGYGTRIFPEGTIIGAHFVQTPDYVQVGPGLWRWTTSVEHGLFR